MNHYTGLALVSLLDGRRLDTFLLDGKPVWRCTQVGELLDYPNRGRRLGTLVTNEWQREFTQGEDYVIPEAEALAELLGGPDPRAARAAHPLFLTSAGLHRVLGKTPTPAGARLLSVLDEGVLPRIAQHPRAAPAKDGSELVLVVLVPRCDRPEARGRHAFDHLVQRALESGLVRGAVRTLLLFTSLSEPQPDERWYSAAEIAAAAGASEEAVAFAIRQLGIRGAPAYSRAAVGAARDGGPQLSFAYNEKGARMIVAVVRETPPESAS